MDYVQRSIKQYTPSALKTLWRSAEDAMDNDFMNAGKWKDLESLVREYKRPNWPEKAGDRKAFHVIEQLAESARRQRRPHCAVGQPRGALLPHLRRD